MPDAELVKIFQELTKVGQVALFHAENGAIIDPLIEELYASGTDEPRGHAWSRPPVSETTSVLKLLELAADLRCKAPHCPSHRPLWLRRTPLVPSSGR